VCPYGGAAEAPTGDDRVEDLDAGGRAGADQHLLFESRRSLRNDRSGDVSEATRVLGAVDEMELLAQVGVLAGCEGVLRRLLTELLVLNAEPVVLGLRMNEPGEVPLRVAGRT